MGTPVFKRDGRRSVPNTLGLRLARNGLAIRLAEEEASVVADQSAKGSAGELRIGAPPIVAGRFITEALSKFISNSQAPPTFECYCQFYGESNLPFCACFFLSCLNSVAPG